MMLALLFPGQGSQSVGMLAALATSRPEVKATFDEASERLGLDLWQLCQQGPERDLNRTEHTQPAMLAAGVASWRVWRALGGPMPDRLAGHSLGEYAALVAAGSLAFGDAVALVAERGRLMQNAVPGDSGAMAAVLGMDDEALEQICDEQAQAEVVSCANYNAPGQVVIAGHRAAVERVCEAAKAAGARRALPLAVSVPSHCALMEPAAEQLASSLAAIAIATPTVPVLHNVDVASHEAPDAIRQVLAQQLYQPVRWTRTIQALASSGIRNFAECGPGKVLAGLNRRIDRSLPCTALLDEAAMLQMMGELDS